MFNEKSITVIKSLIPVSNQFIFKTPRTNFVDEYKQIVGSLNTEILGENFPEEGIAIYDTSTFINTLQLIDDPEREITYDDEHHIINISNDEAEVKYLTSDPSIIEDVDYKIIESTKKVKSVLKFTLNKDIFNKLSKASNVFKELDTIVISKNGEVIISLDTNESFNKINNKYQLKISDYEDDGFTGKQIKIPKESFLRVPKMDYTLEVKYNEERDAYRLILSNKILELVISVIQ